MLQGQENLFNLEGQIEHKLDFIYNYVDKRSNMHLIGHSIGSWMILEALQKHSNLINRISSINLLFPTIQHMAETKNGIFLNNFIRNFHTIALLVFTLAYMLPNYIKSLLIKIYLKFNSLPLHYEERIQKYCNPRVGEKVLFLAYDEMDKVTSLNNYIIEKIKHMTNIIYSNHDGWVPVKYMEDLKCYQPYLQMKVVNIDHAFVLKSAEIIAEMVSDYIKLKLNK
ncbi:hypothetical protein O3G_MSEX006599 [Manduca sexta]|uniref:Lipid droplet-associated hydrolase n=2 Tax=Manduca sexta TaxID=7130 RepID=A0A922CLI1_MANSE|nr:hypothetical protein O3G_MSEX006599 [Manduca sexta]KAG6450456.1 hypothetical protein O3G_MSEX006599 [Manduca sexta]